MEMKKREKIRDILEEECRRLSQGFPPGHKREESANNASQASGGHEGFCVKGEEVGQLDYLS